MVVKTPGSGGTPAATPPTLQIQVQAFQIPLLLFITVIVIIIINYQIIIVIFKNIINYY